MSSRCFEILGKRVAIRSTSLQFAAEAKRFLRSFALCRDQAVEPGMRLSVDVAAPGAQGRGHSLCRDGQAAWTTDNYWQLFRQLEWQLLSHVSTAVHERLLIHAGAVARAGRGTLLPGRSESGKSTLTLALVLRGYAYYSDELAVLDPASGNLEPFAKPISCKDPNASPVLACPGPHWFGPEAPTTGGVWYLHPADLRAEAVGQSVAVDRIVFPRYESQAETRLETLAPGETMRRLIENAVNLPRLGPAGLTLLASLARGCRGYSLVSGSPDAAADAVASLG